MKFMSIRLIVACIWVISAYKWSDWKNWKKYYPTMLFFGMGDMIYIAIFHNKPLWVIETHFLIPPINELFVIFVIFFSTTIIFLSNFPKKLYTQIIYIILWITLYMTIELFTLPIGMITHHNGWNIWWSLLHNTIQFPLIILHHKEPILAWSIAFAFLVIIMKTFNVPFTVVS